MNRLLTTILVLLFSISMLSGCGGGGTTLEGKYILTAHEVDGNDMLEYLNQMVEVIVKEDPDFELRERYIELLSDGKCIVSMSGDEPREAVYRVDEKNIIFIFSDDDDTETVKGTIDDKKITLETEYNGSIVKMVLEKK